MAMINSQPQIEATVHGNLEPSPNPAKSISYSRILGFLADIRDVITIDMGQ